MYKLKLPNFEGPFDLLLYFIKRDELDIYDIPIAKITEEFLTYVRIIKMFDLELAGDFILMISTLMSIKAQLLLPREKDDNGDDIEDPRTEIVQKLLEYKQFKEASKEMEIMADVNRYIFYRNQYDIDISSYSQDDNYKNASLFDLINAFQKIIKRNSYIEPQHNIELFALSVEEQSGILEKEVFLKKRVSFYKFLEGKTKEIIVITFLAILDLVRNNKIYIFQDDLFEDINIASIPFENDKINLELIDVSDQKEDFKMINELVII
ncbi:MAG: segregation/condensation protein A [Candidatus Kapabacteria bacterium]|nr:segregation/condensation protein A [Candidatus Kapabacteria bacterium]